MLAFFRKRVHLMPKISKVKAWVIGQIEGVMKTEFRLGIRTSTRPDFIEGVRAMLIDKDQVQLLAATPSIGIRKNGTLI
jgi:hypothetical protein